MSLRYGENPHQSAALYTDGSGLGIANAEQMQGKELSYNNLVDLDACWALVSEFDQTAVAIIKHTNPCGVGLGASVARGVPAGAGGGSGLGVWWGDWGEPRGGRGGGGGDCEVVC